MPEETTKPSKIEEAMPTFHRMCKHSGFKALFAFIILMIVFCMGAAFGSHHNRGFGAGGYGRNGGYGMMGGGRFNNVRGYGGQMMYYGRPTIIQNGNAVLPATQAQSTTVK